MSTIVKEAIRKLSIECPYKVLKIENVKLTNKPNEHGYLYVKCLIDDSINFKYSIEASTNDNIILYEILDDEKGTIEKNILFNGITENVRTTNIDGIYYLEIEALTSSSLLDIEEKSRSFQDEQMSYDDVIYEILKDYPGFGFGQCMSMPMRIEKPLFQYKETDYEFLKRIASHLGLELVSDIINVTNMFYFGKPTGKAYIVNEDVNYRAAKNIDMYNKMSVFDEKLHDTDYFYYEVKLRESMKIGDLIKFKTRDFYVYNYEAEYAKGELMYTYRFCRPNGIWQEKIYNKKLSGISLEGTVLETTGEILKLKLNIDEKQDINKAAWFIFAPPTGNIFYSMPLVGDNVMLYFQNEYDRPVVTGCVRKNGDTFGRCANPNNRYYATESGNYLDILPGAVNLYRGGMHVSFNDENGISLSSNTSLNIGTPAGISMSAGNVSISGSNKLIVSKSKGGFISLEGDLYNEGTVVYENGSCRELFAPFTDDIPDLGELLAIQSQINLNKFNPSADLISAASGNEAILCGVNKEKSENGELPTFNVNGKFNEGDRVNVIINGKEFPATVKLKSDGSVYAEVDNYSGLIDSGIEAGEKSKPSMKLMGMAVLDSASTGIIDSLKCAPTFARWFGEKTGLGDENSYKANTEEIERLNELQEGIHNILKENSGDEGTFELMTQAIQYASMVAAVGEIGFCVVASTPRIGKSIIKNGKKIKELFGDSKKITSKIEELFDDLGGWFKKVKDKDAIEGGNKTKGVSNPRNINIKEVTPPGSQNPVKVYTDGYAQVNKGKIDTYIRGKIKKPENYSELKDRIEELTKLKDTRPSEFTKEMKNELKDINKKVHNYERSKGMGDLLNKAGIADTVENNEMIADTVLDAAKEVKDGNTKITRYIKGTNKDVIVESWWIIDGDGTPYCSTIILKEVK